MPRALITGVTGQDGSYLAESLLDKGYDVFGMARRESWHRPNCASHLNGKIKIVYGNMSDGIDIVSALQRSKPHEIYNLASQSRPGESWALAPESLFINGIGAIRLFEAARQHSPQSRIYQASSSEMFGQSSNASQNEESNLNPVNPYAAAKVYAHQMARIYRESYGLFIARGILFNHESERRPLHFLTQKVAYGAACAALGITDSPDLNELGRPVVRNGKLALGNLKVARDWGHAEDFVEAMWLMLQQKVSDDFVIGTGQLHSLEDLCTIAFSYVNRDWRKYVISDPELVRPIESMQILADPTKAHNVLGWNPDVSFNEMIKRMVESHLKRLTPLF